MKHNQDLEKIWSQVPVNYYEQGIKKNIFQRIWHRHKIQTLTNIIKNKNYENIADAGCAGGYMTNQIAKLFPNAKIIGLDIYSSAILHAKKKYPRIKFLKCDLHQIPFPNNYFNLITCYETIEHVIDPPKVLKELKRIAKKKSTVIIAMDSGNILFKIIWFFWEKTTGKVWENAHLHPYHYIQLENLIKQVGFKIKQKKFSHLRMEIIFVLEKE